jgi:hypothetical protein
VLDDDRRAAVDHPIQQRDEAIDVMHLAARSSAR